MEIYTLSGLTYTIPPATTGIIEFSGNSIPIQFTKGSGSVFSPDVLTLNSDNISSGRRKLGMLVYVYETKKIYQYNIDNYDTLWNNATGATGPGGATVVISDFGTTVKNNSIAGVTFINAWTASTISGVGGYDDTNASWRVLSTGGSGGGTFTGGTVNGATNFTNGLTANTISATTYQNLPKDIFVTGGTYSDGITTLTNNSGGTFTISGFTDYYTTGFTFNPTTYDLTIQRNNELPDLSVNLSILSSDVTITGGTYNSSNGTATFTNNTGGTFNVTGFLTGFTDVFVTGGTFNDNNRTLTLTRTDNINVDITGFTDVFVTGGTYSNGTTTFTNNTGGIFNVTGLTTPFTGGTVTGPTVFTNGLSANTISATTYLNLPISGFVSGTGTTGTYPVFISGTTIGNSRLVDGANGGVYTFGSQTVKIIDGGSVLNLDRGQSSMNFLLGVTNSFATTVSSTQNQEGLHITSVGDYVLRVGSGTTTVYNVNRANRNMHIGASGYSDYATQKLQITGGLRVTGPYVDSTNSSGSTNQYLMSTLTGTTWTSIPSVSGLYLPLSGGTISGNLIINSGLTATTISATTYFNLPVSDVTGGTGISAATSNGLVTIVNTAPDQIVTITGGTNIGINGTYPNFGINFTGSTGVSGDFLPLSGGTVTGATIFTGGLTTNTISATTYQNLPTDVRVTGGTYSGNTIIFTNNTGGTFSVTGITTSSAFTGGTVTGATNFTNGLTANTISAATISATTYNGYVPIPYSGAVNNLDLGNNNLYVNDVYEKINIIPSISGTTLILENTGVSNYIISGGTGNQIIQMPDATTLPIGATFTFNNNSNYIITINNGAVSPFQITQLNSGAFVTLILSYNTTKAGTWDYHFNAPSNVSWSTNTLNYPGSITSAQWNGTIISLNRGGTNSNITPNAGAVIYSTSSALTLTNSGTTGQVLTSQGSSAPIWLTPITFTGGTVTGATNFTNGLIVNTISATTYQNLPIDIRVTGGTYSNGTVIFTNNTGGTFNVTGLYTGGTDVYVTGGTYSNGTATFTNNTGGTFNVTGITTSSTFTGGTVSGSTIFTNGLTANTISSTTITSPSVKTYGLIVATSLGYQNIF